jgi:DNA-binding NtrC family response regulator
MTLREQSHSTTATRPKADRPSVLIVEDNVALGGSLELLLESHGCDVSRSTDAAGGLRHIMLVDYDAILCDMVMPNLSGDLFYQAVQRIKPHLCRRFVFMSGHREDPRWYQFVRKVDALILWKPFPLALLLEAVQSVLNKATADPAEPEAGHLEQQRPISKLKPVSRS